MNTDPSRLIAQLAAIVNSGNRELQMANYPPPPTDRWTLALSRRELDGRQFVAVDIETTGNNVHVDEPVEIGAVRFDLEGNVLGRFETLVDPSRPVSPLAAAKHGLDSTMLVGQPPLQEALPPFIDFLGGEETLIIQHSNKYFDARILGLAMYELELEYPKNVIVDTMRLSRRLVRNSARDLNPETGNYSYALAALCRSFGIAEDQPHRALPDAELTMQLFLKLCHADPAHLFLRPGIKLQKVCDLFDKKMKPAFFTDLPIVKQVPSKYRGILHAINSNDSLEIEVRDSNGGTCRGIVRPLWITDSSVKKNLVIRFPGETSRERISMEQVVGWEVI